jgi:hypothetical protein
MIGRVLAAAFVAVLIGALLAFVVGVALASAACEPEPVTVNTPTGIAGCEVWGDGIASMYGPGDGAAMNFCTWEVRHSVGCGMVEVAALDTGRTVIVPVIDFCDCYTGTSNQRIIDLQYGVVDALGLPRSAGLWAVHVTPAAAAFVAPPSVRALPDTSLRSTLKIAFTAGLLVWIAATIAVGSYVLYYLRRRR